MPQTGAGAANCLDIDVCGKRTGTGQGFDLPRRYAAGPQYRPPRLFYDITVVQLQPQPTTDITRH